MLKKIVYMTDRGYRKEKIQKFFDKLVESGIETEMTKIDITADTLNWVKDGMGDSNMKNEETLYITDSPVCQKVALQYELPLLLYLHEDNRNSTFLPAAYAIEQIEEIEYGSLLQAYQRLVGEPWHILTTKRCIIRETTTGDVGSFYKIYSDPSITKYMENLYTDRAQEVAYIEDYIKTVYGFYGYGMWTVLTKEDNTVIGRAGINWREGYDIPELGFVIAVPYQRKGYAYEVCRAILEYGKARLGFTCFQVLIMSGNDRSEKLCRKLGFRYLEEVVMEGIIYKRMIFNI